MSKTTNKFSPEVRTRAVRMVLVALGGRGFGFPEDRLFGPHPE